MKVDPGLVRFRAPWGTSVVVVTALGVAVMLCAAAAVVSWAPPGVSQAVVLLLFLAGAWAWAYSPTGYRIGNGELVVERPAGELRFPLTNLRDVQVDARLGMALRVFGNGGLFGGWGWFWSRRVGLFQAAVRRSRPLVMIRMARRTLVVAPDRPEEFVRELETWRR